MSVGESDIFSSDEAVERFYESLEHRAFEQERETDECIQHDARIRTWQKQALSYVSRKSGSNMTEVGYAAYQEGITTINAMMEDNEVKELEKLSDLAFEIVGHKGGMREDVASSYNTILSDGIGDPNQEQGTLDERTTFYFKDSAYSMVKHDYESTAGFEPWVHRAVVTIGLLESDTLPHRPMQLSNDVKANFKEAYKKSRADVEEMLRDFVVDNLFYWEENGVYQGRLEMIKEAIEVMKTESKSDVQRAVDILDSNAEIIEDGER